MGWNSASNSDVKGKGKVFAREGRGERPAKSAFVNCQRAKTACDQRFSVPPAMAANSTHDSGGGSAFHSSRALAILRTQS